MNKQPEENRVQRKTPLWVNILVVLVLYLLQGVTLGIVDSIPLYLASSGASWKQQATLSFVMYPFTLKLLWAPFIDVLYIRQLGRRLTWLLPVQVALGVTFVTISFYLESLLVQLHVTAITVIMFFVIFLVATQDICVDGWALSLFGSTNAIWQSISQMIGQPLGGFFGSPILLIFESANMTNQLVRQPFGLTVQPYGLFTIGQFVRFWGVIFLITTFAITLFFRERSEKTSINEDSDDSNSITLVQTYLSIVRLFKKKCFRETIVIMAGPHLGYAATSAMTYITLISRGIIRRETLGLITMPLILVKVTLPILVSRIRQPLIFFAHSYIPRLVVCILIAIFVFFAPRLQFSPALFYGLLIVLLAINDALTYVQGTARGGFMASISDPRIGSTYYTLLASINNLGLLGTSSAVLYSANWLPKQHAYYIEVGVCTLLGCVWLFLSWRLIHKLEVTPVECWHLVSQNSQLQRDQIDHHNHAVVMSTVQTDLSAGNHKIEYVSYL